MFSFLIACLDQVFPAYEQLFSDMFGKSSTQLLLTSPIPKDLLAVDSHQLIKLVNQASKDRFNLNRSEEKVNQLIGFSYDSFGISVATDVFKLQIQLLLEQVFILEEQLKSIKTEFSDIVEKQPNYLTMITGVRPITAAVIMAEIADIHRLERPN